MANIVLASPPTQEAACRLSGSSVSYQPTDLKIRNEGIIVTYSGIIMVASMITKHGSRPGPFSFAKVKAYRGLEHLHLNSSAGVGVL